MGRHREFEPEVALDSAMRLFWAKGYHNASMAELVECTGVHRGSLYETFGKKRELYLKSLDRFFDTVMSDRLAPLGAEQSPLASLERFFRDLVEWTYTEGKPAGCMLANAAAELDDEAPEVRETVRTILRKRRDLLERLIARGQAEGEIDTGRPAEQLAQYLDTVLLGLPVLYKTDPPRAVFEAVVETALSAVRAPEAVPSA